MDKIESDSVRRFTLYVVGKNYEDALAHTVVPATNVRDALHIMRTRRSLVGDDVALDIFGIDVYADNNTYHWKA